MISRESKAIGLITRQSGGGSDWLTSAFCTAILLLSGCSQQSVETGSIPPNSHFVQPEIADTGFKTSYQQPQAPNQAATPDEGYSQTDKVTNCAVVAEHETSRIPTRVAEAHHKYERVKAAATKAEVMGLSVYLIESLDSDVNGKLSTSELASRRFFFNTFASKHINTLIDIPDELAETSPAFMLEHLGFEFNQGNVESVLSDLFTTIDEDGDLALSGLEKKELFSVLFPDEARDMELFEYLSD